MSDQTFKLQRLMQLRTNPDITIQDLLEALCFNIVVTCTTCGNDKETDEGMGHSYCTHCNTVTYSRYREIDI